MAGGFKGNNTTTSSSAPNPIAAANYYNLLNQAGNVAATPFQQYGGQFVAPVNAQQNLGINNINANAGFASPYIQQATQYANQAAQPISAAQISQYQSPYTQQVVNATQAQFNQQNAQQQSALQGNAIAQGALGGDRLGVAQANLAGQQQLAQAPTIANLYNQGYSTALNTALAEQQNQAQAAYSLGNLGIAGQNAALTGANAQIGAGTLQQQTQQAQDAALYQQFLQQQAYPFQTTQWLAGLDTGVGSNLGGTSTTTPPQPNPIAQYGGLALAGAGLFLRRGGKVPGFDLGGVPYGSIAGYVPTMQITQGRGAPGAPSVGNGQQTDPLKQAQQAYNLGSAFQKNRSNLGGSGGIGGLPDESAADSYLSNWGGYNVTGAGDFSGADAEMADAFFRRGGVAGYDDGGDVPATFDERFTGLGQPIVVPDSNAPIDMTLDQQPGQNVSPQAMADWRSGVDSDASAGFIHPQGEDDALAYAPVGRSPVPAGLGDVPAYADASGAESTSAAPNGTGGPFSGFGLGYLSPAAKQGLLAAGLGMLASRSPNLGNAIGEGGLKGAEAYTGAKNREEQVNEAHQKLQMQAKQHADQLALETKKLALQQEQNEANRSERQFEHQKPVLIGQQPGVGFAPPRNVYGVPQPDGTFKDPITGKTIDPKALQLQPQQSPIQPPAAAPPNPAPAPQPQPAPQPNPTAPQTAPADTPVAQITPPPTMTVGGQPVTQASLLVPQQVAAEHQQASSHYHPEVLSQYSPQEQETIKGVANYDIDPRLFSKRTTDLPRLMGAVKQYRDDFQQGNYANYYKGKYDWDNGKHADTVGSFNTVIDHLATARGLLKALANPSDVTALNYWRNKWKADFAGSPEPTNAAAASQIVGDEIAKAVVGNTNALGDRKEIADNFNRDRALPQQLGVLDTYTALAAGRLNTLRRQYKNATGKDDFEERYLSPDARKAFSGSHGDAGSNAPSTPILPDEAKSKLKEGRVTTFGNGQTWTLRNGQPVQVK